MEDDAKVTERVTQLVRYMCREEDITAEWFIPD